MGDRDKLQGEAIPASGDLDPSGIILSNDTLRSNRIPPRQARTKKWPVLDAWGRPRVDRETWRLDRSRKQAP